MIICGTISENGRVDGMEQLKHYYQEVLNKPYDEKVGLARVATDVIINDGQKYEKSNIVMHVYTNFLAICSSCDGSPNHSTHKFISEVASIVGDYESFVGFARTAMSDASGKRAVMNYVLNYTPEKIRGAYRILAAMICASDGTMTISEQNFLNRFFVK